ncbi:relaxase/mobilization nuclease domain-containing protein [Alicyclobacillus mengziensis]|uniref:MobA/VirD2-like nuclease domain-containing protein n=1 Tax=Alicyclobacillus mengziensis TaxID=2931921 RepID=A0A9X7Z9V4_9BACL|nr:hypothetical protein [Alicyclobacillus mengziensis]QSO50133.1 hypothetical protein JZ786_24515 [Alicyclobacillus mengziensis]
MARVVVKHRYKQDIGQVRAHLKYIGFRARELGEEKGFFNDHQDKGADYETFLNKIEQHQALQHSATVKLHSLIISMRGEDMRAFIEAGGDAKEMTRRVIMELEERKGMKLEWVAAFHDKETHPHVHVAIMAVGVDASGKNKRLMLTKDDYDFLRNAGRRYLEQYVPYEPERGRHQDGERDRGRDHQRSNASNVASGMSHAGSVATKDEMAKKQPNQKKKQSRDKSREQQQKQTDREQDER